MSLEDHITKIKASKYRKKKRNSYRADQEHQTTYHILFYIIEEKNMGWEIGYMTCKKRVNKDTGERFYCKYDDSTTEGDYEGSFFVPENGNDLKDACVTKAFLPNSNLEYVYLWDEELDHDFYVPMSWFESFIKKFK